eukprot:Clim_evm7s87 gene=Clim_evmTU7s87
MARMDDADSLFTKEGNIDLTKLREEVMRNLKDDLKREQLNATKIRAMEDRIPYEEFEARVKAAHIRPLKRGELEMIRNKAPWDPGYDLFGNTQNTFANSNVDTSFIIKTRGQGGNRMDLDQAVSESKTSQQIQQHQTTKEDLPSAPSVLDMEKNPPKTALEFEKVFKRQCADDEARFRYLLTLQPADMAACFSAEIGFGLLGQIAGVLNGNLNTDVLEEVEWAAGALLALSKSKRFSLNVKFLSKKEKATLAELLGKLSQSAQLDQLIGAYGM